MTKYLIIFFIMISSVLIIQVQAIPVIYTPEDLERLSKYTLKGKIINIESTASDDNTTKSDNQNNAVAEISVKIENQPHIQYENYTIEFRATSFTSMDPFSSDKDQSKKFQLGEYVYVFLTDKNPNTSFINSYEGFLASKFILSDGIAYGVTSTKQEPPLHQLQSGIHSRSVNCNEGLELLIKTSDGQPICVKPSTKTILMERDWAKPV